MFRETKKYISLIAVFILIVCLSACSMDNLPDLYTKSDDEEEEIDSSLTVVGFSQPGAESAWRVALTDSVKDAFTERRGYKLIYKDGQSKQDNQIRDIRTFIQMGVDYIILSPIVETGWDTVLEEAKAAGIPVIICDRNVIVSNENLYTAYVGSNFEKEGEIAISYLENQLEETPSDMMIEAPLMDQDGNEILDINGNPIYKDNYNIVHIQGTLNSSAQLGRTEALLSACDKNPNWQVVYEDCGEFTKAKSREIMEDALDTIDSDYIDLIYCENDEEAMGAIAAMNERNIGYGKGRNIAVICFDGTQDALKMCLNGQINLVVECNPLQGPYLYNIVEMLKMGQAVPKITYVDEHSFTQDDLSEEIISNRKY